MPVKKRFWKRVNIQLSPEQYKRLTKFSAQKGRTFAELAKSGTDIRDRGGFIDALCSGLDGFVTSDKQLVGSGPAKRINERFSTKVLTPEQLADELGE